MWKKAVFLNGKSVSIIVFFLTFFFIASSYALAIPVLVVGDIQALVPLTYTSYLEGYPVLFFTEQLEPRAIRNILEKNEVLVLANRQWEDLVFSLIEPGVSYEFSGENGSSSFKTKVGEIYQVWAKVNYAGLTKGEVVVDGKYDFPIYLSSKEGDLQENEGVKWVELGEVYLEKGEHSLSVFTEKREGILEEPGISKVRIMGKKEFEESLSWLVTQIKKSEMKVVYLFSDERLDEKEGQKIIDKWANLPLAGDYKLRVRLSPKLSKTKVKEYGFREKFGSISSRIDSKGKKQIPVSGLESQALEVRKEKASARENVPHWTFSSNVKFKNLSFDKGLAIIPYFTERGKNEYVMMRKKVLAIDIEEYPQVDLQYKLEDLRVQGLGLFLGIDLTGDGREDVRAISWPEWEEKEYIFRENMAGVGEFGEMDASYYLFQKKLGWKKDFTRWYVRNHDISFERTKDEGALRLSLYFDGSSSENEFLQMGKQVKPIDLKEYPYVGITYKVDEPEVQTVEVYLRIDYTGDGKEDGLITGVRPKSAAKEFSEFDFSAYQRAKALFPGKKSYKVVEVGINPHKLWGVDSSARARDYRFYLKEVRVHRFHPLGVTERREYITLKPEIRNLWSHSILTLSLDNLNKIKDLHPYSQSKDIVSIGIIAHRGEKEGFLPQDYQFILNEVAFYKWREERNQLEIPELNKALEIVDKAEGWIIRSKDIVFSDELGKIIERKLQLKYKNWQVKGKNVRYEFKESREGLVLSCEFEKISGDGKCVIMERDIDPAYLTPNSLFSLTYKVDDVKLQRVGVVLGLDFGKDGKIDKELVEMYTFQPKEGWEKLEFNIFKKAEGIFPSRESYKLVKIKIFLRKLEGIEAEEKGKYRFYLKKIEIGNLRSPKTLLGADGIKWIWEETFEESFMPEPISGYKRLSSRWVVQSLNSHYFLEQKEDKLNVTLELNGSPLEEEGISLIRKTSLNIEKYPLLKFSYKIDNPGVLKGEIYIQINELGKDSSEKKIKVADFSPKDNNSQEIEIDLGSLISQGKFRVKGIEIAFRKKDRIDARGNLKGKYTLSIGKVELSQSRYEEFTGEGFFATPLGKRIEGIILNQPVVEVDGKIYTLKEKVSEKNILRPEAEWQDIGKVNLQKGNRRLRALENTLFDIEMIELSNLSISRGFDREARIGFRNINPTRYLVDVEARKPFWLVFNQSFHPGWKAYIRQPSGVKTQGINFEWSAVVSALRDWGKRAELKEHYLVNGYANAWWVPVEELSANNPQTKYRVIGSSDGNAQPGMKEFEIILEFKPQRLFEIGLVISLATFLGCVGYLIRDFARKRKK